MGMCICCCVMRQHETPVKLGIREYRRRLEVRKEVCEKSVYLPMYEALSLLRALPPNHLILSKTITINNNQSL